MDLTKDERNCPKCNQKPKDITSGNMTPYKYKCINNHTYGTNEFYFK